MSNLIGCNYTCQRKKNIVRLKALYEKGLTNYYNAYNNYLKNKYDRSGDRAWKRAYAERTLRPKVENLNKYLNKILASMRKNIATTNRVIKKQSTQISRRRDIIERKNHKIKKQDEDIAKTNIDMISKDRQIVYSKERNSYRRNIMIALLIINILIVASLLKYYK